jgi:hypothetical protein
MATIEIHVPDIGDFDEVTVIELLVKVGDTIEAEQSQYRVRGFQYLPWCVSRKFKRAAG